MTENYLKKIAEFNIEDLSPEFAPSLEMQVVDIADEIAYDNHDLDDGLASGLIKGKDLLDIPMWEKGYQTIEKKYRNINPKIKRYQTIRYLINLQVTDLVKNTKKLIVSKNLIKLLELL